LVVGVTFHESTTFTSKKRGAGEIEFLIQSSKLNINLGAFARKK